MNLPMRSVRIVLFAKAPLPGLVKTRLIPALGAAGAADLARKMLEHAVAEALAAGIGEVELCVTPDYTAEAWQSFRNLSWPVDWQSQAEGCLGERLARAGQRNLASGCPVLLIGTDCPMLGAGQLREAAQKLQDCDAVIMPSTDGGYVLLGLNRFDPHLFRDIAWSTDTVASETLDRIGKLGWSVAQLPALTDIDVPEDLACLPEGWPEKAVQETAAQEKAAQGRFP